MITTTTKVFDLTVARASQEYITISQGGMRSGKTFSIIQILILLALNKPDQLISVVAETRPHLKRGTVRDFIKIMDTDFDYLRWNKTELVYTFPNGSVMEFFSADNHDKLKGAGRTHLFINEADRISYDSWLQLAGRTSGGKIFIDFNPVQRFWAHDLGEVIVTTYQDNNYLPKQQIDFIESQKHNTNWWRVYGLGQIGKLENLVYPEYTLNELPKEYKWRIYGLDFGFTNDPTALIEVRYAHGELWLKEHIYDYGMTNQDIAKEIHAKGITDLIVADSAEPKSIKELKQANVKVIGAEKKQVMYGIQLANSYKINLCLSSENLIKEFKNYMYKKKNGEAINEPIDAFNHLLDAFRYALIYKMGASKTHFYGIKAT